MDIDTLSVINDPTLRAWYFEERNCLALSNGEVVTSTYSAVHLQKIVLYIQETELLNGGLFFGKRLPVKLVTQGQIESLFNDESSLNNHIELKDEKLSEIGEFFKRLQQKAVMLESSDIHIELYEHEVKFYVRVDGRRLVLSETIPDHAYGEALFSYIFTSKAISKDHDYVEKLPNSGKLEQLLLLTNKDENGEEIMEPRLTSWRADYIPAKGGGKITLRWLNAQQSIPPLDTLGWTDGHVDIIMDFLKTPSGVCIFSGKTGSGKSTSIASTLDLIDEESAVHTLEDPDEFNLGIPQTVVTSDKNSDTKSGFATYSKVLLRHDVDVELHGEVRDHAGAMEVTRKGETGQLVFTSLHTSSAIGIAHTLTEQLKVPPSVVSAPALMKVWAYQTLVRKLCPHCKLTDSKSLGAYDTNELGDDYHRARIALDSFLKPEFREHVFWRNPNGCKHCNKGEKGRTALIEMIILDDEDRDFILRKDYLNWQVALKNKGFKTVRDHAINKIQLGEIDVLTAAKKVNQLIPQSSSDVYATLKL